MHNQVDRGAGQHWPPNQWHPAYASVKDWLDNEAPEADTDGNGADAKARNNKRHRRYLMLRRGR